MKGRIKRTLSLILSICMLLGVMQTTIFAAPSDTTKKGYYDKKGNFVEGDLKQTLPNGIKEVDKKIKKLSDNEYEVTLKVVAEETENAVLPGSAATVLVIDTSGSMNDDNRLENAKNAAKDFVEKFSGDAEGVGRYVAIVTFDDDVDVELGWTDISTKVGKKEAIDEINEIDADGGTNLQAGLIQANALMKKEKVNSIPKEAKNVIVLTDGAPTYYLEPFDPGIFNWVCDLTIDGVKYDLHGYGSSGSKKINEATEESAKELKKNANVFTVCYGARNDKTYRKGPKVGEFLKNSVSSGEKFAYDADNATELNDAFKAITDTIVDGIDGNGLQIVTKNPNNSKTYDYSKKVEVTENNFVWTLTDPTIEKIGNTTRYTYELKYKFKFDANDDSFNENEFYPVSGESSMKITEEDGTVKEVKFPEYIAKPVKSRYVVTYTDGKEEKNFFDDEQNKGIIHGTNTPAFSMSEEEINKQVRDYVFAGWEPAVADKVTESITYKATWDADSNNDDIADKDQRFTVTYTDGMNEKVLFADESYSGLKVNAATPKFSMSKEEIDKKVSDYVFAGWEPTVADKVTKDITYKATWDADLNNDDIADKNQKFTVTYTDGVKGAEIFADEVTKNLAVNADTPKFSKTDDQLKKIRENFVFIGWNPGVVDKVTKDITYVATWADDKNNDGKPDEGQLFTVTYTDGMDEKVLFADESYSGLKVNDDTPKFSMTKEEIDKKVSNYVFAGWEPTFAAKVTESITYKAKWDADLNNDDIADKDQTFTVTYTDGMDGKELFADKSYKDLKVNDDTPAFPMSKEEIDKKVSDYVFAGWEPTVADKVTESVTYKATWDADLNNDDIADKDQRFTVTYTDGMDGKVLFADKSYKDLKVNDDTPAFPMSKEEIDKKVSDYVFAGWEPTVAAKVTESITYKAKWYADLNNDDIADKDQTFTVTYTDGVPTIKIFDDEVTKDLAVNATTPKFSKTDDELKKIRKDFVFIGWNPTFADKVTKDITYEAVWADDKNNDGIADEGQLFTVTYTDGVDAEEIFANEVYNNLKVNDNTPEFSKSLEKIRKDYVFMGWTPEFAEKVMGNVTYTAVWADDKNNNGIADDNEFYDITYTDGVDDEVVFEDVTTSVKVLDNTPAFDGKPVRHDYVFTGWNPEVADIVTGKAVYAATWADDKNNNGIPDDQEVIIDDETPLAPVDPPVEKPAEKPATKPAAKPAEPEKVVIDDETPLGNAPHTNDGTDIVSAVAGVAVTGAACLFVMKKRKEEN